LGRVVLERRRAGSRLLREATPRPALTSRPAREAEMALNRRGQVVQDPEMALAAHRAVRFQVTLRLVEIPVRAAIQVVAILILRSLGRQIPPRPGQTPETKADRQIRHPGHPAEWTGFPMRYLPIRGGLPSRRSRRWLLWPLRSRFLSRLRSPFLALGWLPSDCLRVGVESKSTQLFRHTH
jgi:hypothetical protein